MPLPTRNANEPHDQFIERCMGDPVMVREFPDAAKRRSVAGREADRVGLAHGRLCARPAVR